MAWCVAGGGVGGLLNRLAKALREKECNRSKKGISVPPRLRPYNRRKVVEAYYAGRPG